MGEDVPNAALSLSGGTLKIIKILQSPDIAKNNNVEAESMKVNEKGWILTRLTHLPIRPGARIIGLRGGAVQIRPRAAGLEGFAFPKDD